MTDDSLYSTLIDTVRQFTNELAQLRHEEQAEREALNRDVSDQVVALRHDMYGSVLQLDQAVVELRKVQQDWQKDTLVWREQEQERREQGQRSSRHIWLGVFALLVLVVVGVGFLMYRVLI